MSDTCLLYFSVSHYVFYTMAMTIDKLNQPIQSYSLGMFNLSSFFQSLFTCIFISSCVLDITAQYNTLSVVSFVSHDPHYWFSIVVFKIKEKKLSQVSNRCIEYRYNILLVKV